MASTPRAGGGATYPGMLLGLLPAASPSPCLESSELSCEPETASRGGGGHQDCGLFWACSPALPTALLCSRLRPRAHIALGLAVAGRVLPQSHPRVPGKAFRPVEVGVGQGRYQSPRKYTCAGCCGQKPLLGGFLVLPQSSHVAKCLSW